MQFSFDKECDTNLENQPLFPISDHQKSLVVHHGTTSVPSDKHKNLPKKLSTENSIASAHRLLQHTYPLHHYNFFLLLRFHFTSFCICMRLFYFGFLFFHCMLKTLIFGFWQWKILNFFSRPYLTVVEYCSSFAFRVSFVLPLFC